MNLGSAPGLAWSTSEHGDSPRIVDLLPGEGVGPEVVAAAATVLERVAGAERLALELRPAPAGAPAEVSGSLSEETARVFERAFAGGGAVLCGPYGGRFVYEVRARFDLFCKVVPIRPTPALADVSVVRPERLADVDVLLVRENVGGVYLGEWVRRNGVAEHRFSYSVKQVARLLAVAVHLASRRRGRVAVVVKSGGVPAASALWAEVALAVARPAGVDVEVLEADNAGFQMIADPHRFDVVAAPNLLGDLLADAATILLGSRGMSHSANFGPGGRAVYQTGHGAARDLAGSDRANPVAQILSAATMLRESFGFDAAAGRVERAVEVVLASGVRTADVAGPSSRVVGTRELAERIADEAARS